MAYIVDLTHILEILIVGGNRKKLTRLAIKLALDVYLKSDIKAQAYDKIRRYRDVGSRDPVLQTIESLITPKQWTGSADLHNRDLHNKVQSAGPLDGDEEW
jgi:hypothetical protein